MLQRFCERSFKSSSVGSHLGFDLDCAKSLVKCQPTLKRNGRVNSMTCIRVLGSVREMNDHIRERMEQDEERDVRIVGVETAVFNGTMRSRICMPIFQVP